MVLTYTAADEIRQRPSDGTGPEWLQIPARRLALLIVAAFHVVGIPSLHAQTHPVEGVVVIPSGETVAGIIENEYWRRTPTQVRFRAHDAGKVASFTPPELRAFRMGDAWFESHLVALDEMPLDRAIDAAPAFREEHVFLEVLIRGPISLYRHEALREHFFIDAGGGIEELVSHRRLLVAGNNTIDGWNMEFRKQLARACPGRSAETLEFGRRPIQRFVEACNRAIDESAVAYIRPLERILPLTFRTYAGAGRTALAIGQTEYDGMELSPEVRLDAGVITYWTLPRSRDTRAFLLDLRASRVFVDTTGDFPIVYGGVCAEGASCVRWDAVHLYRDTHVDGWQFAALLGYRQRMLRGGVRPFVEAGAGPTATVDMRAGTNVHVTTSWTRHDGSVDQIVEERPDEAFEFNAFSWAAAAGVGLELRSLSVSLRSEWSPMVRGARGISHRAGLVVGWEW
jgi:hypothetical protein